MHVDSTAGPDAFLAVWRPFGQHMAVAVGSAVALISLFVNAPVRIASLRGALAWAAILCLTRTGCWLLARTWAASQDEESEADQGGKTA